MEIGLENLHVDIGLKRLQAILGRGHSGLGGSTSICKLMQQNSRKKDSKNVCVTNVTGLLLAGLSSCTLNITMLCLLQSNVFKGR